MNPPDVAIITGAAGGMGRACARELGRNRVLLLTDIDREKLEDTATGLREDGYVVGDLVAGDLSEALVARDVVARARSLGRLRVLAHAAGLSPALAPWDRILRANLVATEHLLAALETNLDGGFVAVLIASMAGHMAPVDADLDALLAEPLSDGFLQAAQALLEPHRRADDPFGLASPAYGASKRAVIRLCEARAAKWGVRGARIVSISPGTVWTPMGRAEERANPAAAAVVAATPVGRWGSALDIAAAAAFLASDAAGFITGCDLRIDGGVTPALRGVAF